MFLRNLSRASKKIGFQVSIRYTTILIVCALLMFLASHFTLSAIFADKDKKSIQHTIGVLSKLYERDGLDAVKNEVARTRNEDLRKNFFVRVASRDNSTLYSTDPAEFEDFDVETAVSESNSCEWMGHVDRKNACR